MLSTHPMRKIRMRKKPTRLLGVQSPMLAGKSRMISG